MQKGAFISFEGGEGAGKSSLIQYLSKFLQGKGFSVICTREPGGTSLGEKIRQLLLNVNSEITIGSTGELLLFLASRSQHLEEIILPALAQSKIVLCDRFNDSTVAYQGVGRGLGRDYVYDFCQKACHHKNPDLTLLLDVPVEIGLKRILKVHKQEVTEGNVDRIESEDLKFHEKVRQAFLYSAKIEPDRFAIIDASKNQEEVFKEATKVITTKLGCNV